MITIATAECFTHGKIGLELHALAQNYKGNFGSKYINNLDYYGDFDYNELSVICSLFIPTIDAVKDIEGSGLVIEIADSLRNRDN